jgi:hypothetical protein
MNNLHLQNDITVQQILAYPFNLQKYKFSAIKPNANAKIILI